MTWTVIAFTFLRLGEVLICSLAIREQQRREAGIMPEDVNVKGTVLRCSYVWTVSLRSWACNRLTLRDRHSLPEEIFKGSCLRVAQTYKGLQVYMHDAVLGTERCGLAGVSVLERTKWLHQKVAG